MLEIKGSVAVNKLFEVLLFVFIRQKDSVPNSVEIENDGSK